MTDIRTSQVSGRRGFLIRSCRACAACLAVPLWNLLGGCGAGPADEPAGPLAVTLAELPLNRRVRLENEGRPVEVMRTDNGVTAVSLLCTHQGCNVRWIESEQIYFCPCHDGKFDADGKPFYGPPREPLRRLNVTLTPTEAVIDG